MKSINKTIKNNLRFFSATFYLFSLHTLSSQGVTEIIEISYLGNRDVFAAFGSWKGHTAPGPQGVETAEGATESGGASLGKVTLNLADLGSYEAEISFRVLEGNAADRLGFTLVTNSGSDFAVWQFPLNRGAFGESQTVQINLGDKPSYSRGTFDPSQINEILLQGDYTPGQDPIRVVIESVKIFQNNN